MISVCCTLHLNHPSTFLYHQVTIWALSFQFQLLEVLPNELSSQPTTLHSSYFPISFLNSPTTWLCQFKGKIFQFWVFPFLLSALKSSNLTKLKVFWVCWHNQIATTIFFQVSHGTFWFLLKTKIHLIGAAFWVFATR